MPPPPVRPLTVPPVLTAPLRRKRRSSTPRSWTRLRRSERIRRRRRAGRGTGADHQGQAADRPGDGQAPRAGRRRVRRNPFPGKHAAPDPADPNNAAQPLSVDLSAAELDLAKQEAAERTADLQRVTAEYANYRKRVDRDRESVVTAAKASVVAGTAHGARRPGPGAGARRSGRLVRCGCRQADRRADQARARAGSARSAIRSTRPCTRPCSSAPPPRCPSRR